MFNILISHALCAMWLGIFTIHLFYDWENECDTETERPTWREREMNYSIVFQHWQINALQWCDLWCRFGLNIEVCCCVIREQQSLFFRSPANRVLHISWKSKSECQLTDNWLTILSNKGPRNPKMESTKDWSDINTTRNSSKAMVSRQIPHQLNFFTSGSDIWPVIIKTFSLPSRLLACLPACLPVSYVISPHLIANEMKSSWCLFHTRIPQLNTTKFSFFLLFSSHFGNKWTNERRRSYTIRAIIHNVKSSQISFHHARAQISMLKQ